MLNVNVGILGHIDSGKTSIAKAVSSVSSTACFDKSPQSKERGITLDLGFSSFVITNKNTPIQFTLVDCPGHASLIRTVIGGAQIIDIMVLVIDITKGIQTQTSEGIVIGSITANKFLVVLNKIDLLPEKDEEERKEAIKKIEAKLRKALSSTPFANAQFIPFAAEPRIKKDKKEGEKGKDNGENGETSKAESDEILVGPSIGVDELKDSLYKIASSSGIFENREKLASLPFLMMVDHCFPIKGQGTVLTGTILRGKVKVNDNIEIPSLKMERKVKSMQVFHKPVNQAVLGERVGVCLTQFDHTLFERGLICEAKSVSHVSAAIVNLQPIQWFKGEIESKSKLHVTIGHSTVLATVFFFGKKGENEFNIGENYEYCEKFNNPYLEENSLSTSISSTSVSSATASASSASSTSSTSSTTSIPTSELKQWALFVFDQPTLIPAGSMYIASKLETDINLHSCRLAFHGTIVHDYSAELTQSTPQTRLKIFKEKHREGTIDRLVDKQTLICKGLFKKETNPDLFLGLKVTLPALPTAVAKVDSTFGKTGKVKVVLSSGELPTSMKQLTAAAEALGLSPNSAQTVKLSFLNRVNLIHYGDEKDAKTQTQKTEKLLQQ